MRGGQIKHPYVFGLRSSLKAILSDSFCEDIVVGEECCNSIVQEKDGNIKDFVVSLPSLFINTKVFPFPVFNVLISVKCC